MIRVVKQEVEATKRFEQGNPKLVTVPDQVQGLNEMLQRFRRGELLMKRAVYNNEAELPDLRKMDLVDVTELKQKLNNDVETERNKQKRIKAKYEAQKRTEQSANNPTDPPAGAV